MRGPTQNVGLIGSAVLTFIGYKRTDRLIQLLIVVLSVSSEHLLFVKYKKITKKIRGFKIFCRAFSKFYKNQNLFKYKFL